LLGSGGGDGEVAVPFCFCKLVRLPARGIRSLTISARWRTRKYASNEHLRFGDVGLAEAYLNLK